MKVRSRQFATVLLSALVGYPRLNTCTPSGASPALTQHSRSEWAETLAAEFTESVRTVTGFTIGFGYTTSSQEHGDNLFVSSVAPSGETALLFSEPRRAHTIHSPSSPIGLGALVASDLAIVRIYDTIDKPNKESWYVFDAPSGEHTLTFDVYEALSDPELQADWVYSVTAIENRPLILCHAKAHDQSKASGPLYAIIDLSGHMIWSMHIRGSYSSLTSLQYSRLGSLFASGEGYRSCDKGMFAVLDITSRSWIQYRICRRPLSWDYSISEFGRIALPSDSPVLSALGD